MSPANIGYDDLRLERHRIAEWLRARGKECHDGAGIANNHDTPSHPRNALASGRRGGPTRSLPVTAGLQKHRSQTIARSAQASKGRTLNYDI